MGKLETNKKVKKMHSFRMHLNYLQTKASQRQRSLTSSVGQVLRKVLSIYILKTNMTCVIN